jgi:hypothetical protein
MTAQSRLRSTSLKARHASSAGKFVAMVIKFAALHIL